jgi:RNA polymerase sigma-70 factor (ECF subfamily)
MTTLSSSAFDNDTLSTCLIAVARADRLAFSKLYDLTCGVLFTTALQMMRHRSEAEDVLQDAMVKIWKKANLYDPKTGSAMAWLLTITRNTARDRLRSIKRKSLFFPKIVAHHETEFPAFDYTAEDFLHNEQSQAINKALEKLPKPERDAIALNFLKGLSSVEVAAAIGAPLSTIKSRIRRGLLKLRGLQPQLAQLN